MKKSIIEEGLGEMHPFYDYGIHIAVAHRFNLQILEYISNNLKVKNLREHLQERAEGLVLVLYLKETMGLFISKVMAKSTESKN